jgi:glycosyltransferase involved in cell wall biosynthesis
LNPLRLGWGFRKLNYAAADAGIFGNRAALARAQAFGFHKRMEVIPQYGFEITYDGNSRPADGRFAVGYAGRLVREKGVLDLVEATRGMEHVDVLIAGDGPLAAALRAEPQVKVLGWVPRPQMGAYWAQLDALVLPSLTLPNKSAEQFGRVLVEAMAAGVPVIGSTAGAIPDTIGDAGIVYEEGDVTALREALDSLRHDPARRAELRQRGLRRVRDCYSNDVVMSRTVRFYEEVLAGRRR